MNFFRALVALLVVIAALTSVTDAAPFFGLGRRARGGRSRSRSRSRSVPAHIGNRIVPDPYAFVGIPELSHVFPAQPFILWAQKGGWVFRLRHRIILDSKNWKVLEYLSELFIEIRLSERLISVTSWRFVNELASPLVEVALHDLQCRRCRSSDVLEIPPSLQ